MSLDQGVLAFDASKDEGSEQSCYRLVCKHAFHAQCIVTCLRTSGSKCPVCRDGDREIPPIAAFHFIRDGNFVGMQMDDDSESSEEEEGRMNPAQRKLVSQLYSNNSRVKTATLHFKSKLKEYYMLREKLRKERRAKIEESLKGFRKEYKKVLQDKVRNVCQAKQEQVRVLNEELSKRRDAELDTIPLPTTSDVKQALQMENREFGETVRHQDPMRESFWHA